MTEDVKERLLSAAEDLIRGGKKQSELTVRDIAAQADTSPGLINYHFKSKDALLTQAVERIWADFTPRWAQVTAAGPAGVEDLKNLLKDIGEAVDRTAAGAEFKVRHELMEGDMGTVKFIVPVLKNILPPGTPEKEIKLAAFAMVAPLQLLFLRRDFFAEWTGTDLSNRQERDKLFDFIVDRILGPYRG
ncbi:MAG: TetR/AcrR family transcriptional regulator [Spirochaetales bacterium]|nr:MAG: TetR/AcrR family transcriptional regulator [Spirochaetales bacterium]